MWLSAADSKCVHLSFTSGLVQQQHSKSGALVIYSHIEAWFKNARTHAQQKWLNHFSQATRDKFQLVSSFSPTCMYLWCWRKTCGHLLSLASFRLWGGRKMNESCSFSFWFLFLLLFCEKLRQRLVTMRLNNVTASLEFYFLCCRFEKDQLQILKYWLESQRCCLGFFFLFPRTGVMLFILCQTSNQEKLRLSFRGGNFPSFCSSWLQRSRLTHPRGSFFTNKSSRAALFDESSPQKKSAEAHWMFRLLFTPCF